MKFSIIHPSARPEQWRDVFNAWRDACTDWNEFEYVLVCDTRWGFASSSAEVLKAAGIGPEGPKVVYNEGRRCYVDSVNEGATHATGDVLIVIADDQFPCERWNDRLADCIRFAPRDEGSSSEFVIEVSTGTVKEHDRGIVVMPVLSRSRYDRLGYVFYPAYESMYADNDFFEHAKQDGAILDGRGMLFPHNHPLIALEQEHFGEKVSPEVWNRYVAKGLWDDRYQAQHRPEAYSLGRRVLEMRRAAKFGPVSAAPSQRIMALCLPGDSFSSPWVGAVLGIQQRLMAKGWAVFAHQAFSSLAYFTRQTLLESVLEQEPRAEYVLWLDPDNILSVENMELLLSDLDAYPEVESVAGWYWLDMRDGTFRTSAGMRDDGQTVYVAADQLQAANGLVEVAWHGFGCVLMRRSCLEKAGPLPFASVAAPESRYGMTGEDVSFCLHATERAGVKFLVDPRVFVPHLKLGSIGPAGLSKTQREPVIVTCIRARNESRNIARCLRSVEAISKTVLVLDDHSSDDTALIAGKLGATVYASAFRDVDEGRDRQFLLERAREVAADFILTIDADEALDQRDLGTLLNACKLSGLDGLYLRWMHLWDSDDQIRVDGVYGKTSSPLRLFRVTPQLRFRSVSHGLHFQPVNELRKGFCDVRLWHWGYLEQAARVRKYEFYTKQDPANLEEDCYRHLVQGDLPDVPPDVRLVKAGPLQLKKLLPGLAPVTTASGPTERTIQQWQ